MLGAIHSQHDSERPDWKLQFGMITLFDSKK